MDSSSKNSRRKSTGGINISGSALNNQSKKLERKRIDD
jgi:hypothetical protein